jgi:steroid delta-isomerase-like uncharacterized protein
MRDSIIAANDATYAAWNAHDPDGVAAVFALEAEVVDVGMPEPLRGREAIRGRAADLFAAFPDFHLERLFLVVDGQANADRWRATGTHRGAFMGLEPTGRSIDVQGATFSEFDADGLVVRDHNYWDVPTLLAQLGGAAPG